MTHLLDPDLGFEELIIQLQRRQYARVHNGYNQDPLSFRFIFVTKNLFKNIRIFFF